MSENECRNGHVFPGSQIQCPICGEPVYRIDGLTEEEEREMEKDMIRKEEIK